MGPVWNIIAFLMSSIVCNGGSSKKVTVRSSFAKRIMRAAVAERRIAHSLFRSVGTLLGITFTFFMMIVTVIIIVECHGIAARNR